MDSLNSVNCSFAVLGALHLEIWKRSAIIIKIPAVSPSPSIYNVETLKNCRHQSFITVGGVGGGAVQARLYSGAVVRLAKIGKSANLSQDVCP